MVWKPHVTVAAVVEDDGKFLMVEELIRGKLKLNQPAGHLEPGEDPARAVLRELKEETGWQGEVRHLLPIHLWRNPDNRKTFLRFSYAVTATRFDDTAPLDDGIVQAVWLTADEIHQRRKEWRSPMIGRCVDEYLRGHRLPVDTVTHINPTKDP